ncbi:MAG: TetR/AcrR family transcriptional regulator, partial [Chlamydiia bacterium]|nr:TetR/AcrR family transcriptional regulator [Chlamydiia bacterium]
MSRPYQSKTRNQQAEKTKYRLLTVAKKLFQKNGFEKITIDMIAEKAGVSPSLIYHLFKSKRGIIQTLIDEALPPKTFQSLVEKSLTDLPADTRLRLAATI